MSADPRRRLLLLGVLASCAAGAARFAPRTDSFVARVRQLLARASPSTNAEYELARAIVYGDARPIMRCRMSDALLCQRIRANIQADYRRGRIVSRDGWQLSGTEADALELMRRMQMT